MISAWAGNPSSQNVMTSRALSPLSRSQNGPRWATPRPAKFLGAALTFILATVSSGSARFARAADQHSGTAPFRAGDDIQQQVHAVNQIDIFRAGRTPARRMAGEVMRSKDRLQSR